MVKLKPEAELAIEVLEKELKLEEMKNDNPFLTKIEGDPSIDELIKREWIVFSYPKFVAWEVWYGAFKAMTPGTFHVMKYEYGKTKFGEDIYKGTYLLSPGAFDQLEKFMNDYLESKLHTIN